MKYYAVKKGYETGVFDHWEECKKNVKGFSKAEYKSFANKNDARDYLNNKTEYLNENLHVFVGMDYKAVAYCNSSYDNENQKFSYGLVILYGSQIIEFSNAFHDFDNGRNVAGEIFSAMKAMNYCLENDIEYLDLYYDYAGIKALATGEWKADKEITKIYASFYDEVKNLIDVNFIKDGDHTGVHLNERADQLAKAALGFISN